jgi:hypothetical protein
MSVASRGSSGSRRERSGGAAEGAHANPSMIPVSRETVGSVRWCILVTFPSVDRHRWRPSLHRVRLFRRRGRNYPRGRRIRAESWRSRSAEAVKCLELESTPPAARSHRACDAPMLRAGARRHGEGDNRNTRHRDCAQPSGGHSRRAPAPARVQAPGRLARCRVPPRLGHRHGRRQAPRLPYAAE